MNHYQVGQQAAVYSLILKGKGVYCNMKLHRVLVRVVHVKKLTAKLVHTDDGSRWFIETGKPHPRRSDSVRLSPMTDEFVAQYQELVRKKADGKTRVEAEQQARALFIQRVEALRGYLVELSQQAIDKDEEAFANEVCDAAIRGWEHRP